MVMSAVIAMDHVRNRGNSQFGPLSLAHHPQRLPVIFSSFFIKYECLLW